MPSKYHIKVKVSLKFFTTIAYTKPTMTKICGQFITDA